jgi:hypothetical protein
MAAGSVCRSSIARNDLGSSRHAAVEKLRATRQTAHPMPSLFQRLEQSPADVPRCSRQEDQRFDVEAHLLVGHRHLNCINATPQCLPHLWPYTSERLQHPLTSLGVVHDRPGIGLSQDNSRRLQDQQRRLPWLMEPGIGRCCNAGTQQRM